MAGLAFVLGSGFSAAFSLPTLRGLFAEIMQGDGPDNDKPVVLGALEHLYPHFRIGSAAFPPFEEFLSLVETAQDLPQYAHPPSTARFPADALFARRAH